MALCWSPALSGPKVSGRPRRREARRNEPSFSVALVLMGTPVVSRKRGGTLSPVCNTPSRRSSPTTGPSLCPGCSQTWSSSPGERRCQVFVLHVETGVVKCRALSSDSCWERCQWTAPGYRGSDMMDGPWEAAQSGSGMRNGPFCEHKFSHSEWFHGV